jgi:hypothetical protein
MAGGGDADVTANWRAYVAAVAATIAMTATAIEPDRGAAPRSYVPLAIIH